MESSPTSPRNLDRLGVWLSSACVVHCLGTPVLLFFLPALSTPFFGEWVHQTLAIILPLVALLAFAPGFRHHRDLLVIFLGLLGVALIAFAAFNPALGLNGLAETLITTTGSLSLIVAHWRNRQLLALPCQNKNHRHHHG